MFSRCTSVVSRMNYGLDLLGYSKRSQRQMLFLLLILRKLYVTGFESTAPRWFSWKLTH